MGLIILFSGSSEAAPTPPFGPGGRLFPYLAQDPLRATMRFATVVTRLHDGSERRVALHTKPYEQYDLTYLLSDAEARDLRAELIRYPADARLVPLQHHQLVARTAVTGATISVKTTDLSDFVAPGQRVLVVNEAARTGYAGTVQSATTTTVTLDVGPPAGSFPANVTSIFPLGACFFQQPVASERFAVNLSRVAIRAKRLRPDGQLGAGAAAPVVFDSIRVLDRQPLVDGTAAEQTDAVVDEVDYGGVPESYFPDDVRGPVQRSHQFLAQGDAEIQWWRNFLSLIRGRQKLFLMPTWRADLAVADQPVDENLHVQGNYYTNYLGAPPDPIWQYLRVELANGTALYREVISVVDEGDGTETIVLDAPIDTGSVGLVVKISFLEQVRLASDEVLWDFRCGDAIVAINVVNCPA